MAWCHEGEERGKPAVEPDQGQGKTSLEKRGHVCKSDHVWEYMTNFQQGEHT